MNRELPILFNTEMVRAILDGRKTVTRRLIKPQPTYNPRDGFSWKGVAYGTDLPPTIRGAAYNFRCAAPYQQGDVLYVRETWHKYQKRVGEGKTCRIQEFYGYRASVANSEDADEPWKPSIHMPKDAARIWLKVADVRVERLQEMTPQEAYKEGARCNCMSPVPDCAGNKAEFIKVWNSTIKKSELDQYGWDANPYVWVIEFERCENK